MHMSFIHKKSWMINEVRRLNGSCVRLERDGYMLAFQYPMWTYLPSKRGHLKKGTNAVGRVHTQSSFNYITIQILSAGNYYQYIEAINKLFCITVYPQGLNPIKHATIVSY